jgi:hypothetical protein
MRRSSTSLEVA